MILTINFDPLSKYALRTEGIEPVVVSSPDQIQGLPPLLQVRCLVVKLHGDYQDPRFRNTTQELSRYDPRLRKFLAGLLEDFGLVVCGWSAEWDHALRAALERVLGRRFTLFWAHRGPLRPPAATLVTLKQAQAIQIAGADSFFTALGERLAALDQFDRPHPLSVRLAVETLKTYLVDPLHRIHLRDLLSQETEAAYAEAFSEQRFPLSGIAYDGPNLVARLEAYGAALERIQALLVAGAAWGDPQHLNVWQKALERLARPPQPAAPPDYLWRNARGYAALRLLYAAGLAAVATSQFGTFRGLVTVPVRTETGESAPLVFVLRRDSWVDPGTLKRGLGEHSYVPMSEHLFTALRSPLRELIPADDDYNHLFDLVEYLMALMFLDYRDRGGWFPPGRFVFKLSETHGVRARALADIEHLGASWPVLQAGIVGGEIDRFRALDQTLATKLDLLRSSL